MDKTLSTKDAWRAEDTAMVNKALAEVALSNQDPTWHPEEAYELTMNREIVDLEKLYHGPIPPKHAGAVRFYGPQHNSLPPSGTAAEEQALHTFMNMAGAVVERDMVVLPEHYARFKIEPIRFICENNLNFFQANIVKYVLRYDAKNGMEDLKKAMRYLTMFIKFVEGDTEWWAK